MTTSPQDPRCDVCGDREGATDPFLAGATVHTRCRIEAIDSRPRRYVATIHFVKDDVATELATWTLNTWQEAHEWVTSRDIGDIIRPYVTAIIITEEQRHLEWDRLSVTRPWWQPIEMDGYVISKELQTFVRTYNEPVA